ncbi:sulfur oxidation c-type cytochrome SoxA [Rubellimicrobium roseum]|uniref:L-cysteine S-thiosulfotransferase subunit SoxA n=1 Tax=Rubellimicrobium roseum TaxID=687525 RepID=A0A5C4NDF5_9RHOB|nr:sulfur oxidation c-type cytochrome SoxA [Rubellimicrobium roseum]TNC71338.1 sulfur oxidation c-type cytochrome SoxA [Rubellimicrobium roseum]
MILRAALLAGGLATAAAAEDRRTGYEMMSPELRAMQDDEMSNPGMLWVAEGAALWEAPEGPAGRSCAGCHGEAAQSMAGVAARYPAWDEASGAPVDLSGRIALCRTRHQGAEALEHESRPLLALAAYVARQSDGRPIAPDPDPRLDPWRETGRVLFTARMGQLNLACANCHDDHAGGRLGAAPIPEAHPTGYPQYRLQWEEMGGLHRRFGNCLTGIRAKPFAAGSPDYVALELYLMSRAAGLPLEAPAVRP